MVALCLLKPKPVIFVSNFLPLGLTYARLTLTSLGSWLLHHSLQAISQRSSRLVGFLLSETSTAWFGAVQREGWGSPDEQLTR